jgi:hypothetical protein
MLTFWFVSRLTIIKETGRYEPRHWVSAQPSGIHTKIDLLGLITHNLGRPWGIKGMTVAIILEQIWYVCT